MRAVVFDQPGDESVLHIGEAPAPALGANDVRIAVRATAVNRADLLQRQGFYPPPAGASAILGLECGGEIAEVGAAVRGWTVGERAMALLAGGGYAEQAVVDAGSVMRVPKALSDEEGGAFPEVFLTAFLNIFMLGAVPDGGSVLVHGGGSGVGTAAITLCREAGIRIIVTAGSAEKCRAVPGARRGRRDQLPRRRLRTGRARGDRRQGRRRRARRDRGALPRGQPRRAGDERPARRSSA